MEQTHHHNRKSLTEFSKSYQFPKKTTQILVSVSALSLLFLNPFPLISFLRSFNFSFSSWTLPFQQAIDKNCLFLLCNGILVFVAKFSGSVDSSTTVRNAYDELYDASVPMVLESKLTLLEEEETAVVVRDQETDLAVAKTYQEAYLNLEDHERNQEKENGLLLIGGDGEGKDESFGQENCQKEVNGELSVTEEEEEEEEEDDDDDDDGGGVLSIEELNKKFEEFIRKMKEEIRFEAQQQLVTVN